MNMITTVAPPALPIGPAGAPIAILRALPLGPLAEEYERLRRLAELFAPLNRADMAAGVELLIAELDAHDGDIDMEDSETSAGDVDAAGRYLPAIENAEAGHAFDVDCEPEEDREGGDTDEEPTLGAPEEYSGRWGDDVGSADPMADDAEADDPAALIAHAARLRRLDRRYAPEGVR